MTHYEVNYAELTPQEAHVKALADIVDYLGAKKFCELTKIMKADRIKMAGSKC